MANVKEKKKAPNVRVAEALRARVALLEPGDALGTEVAIAEEFGVSRMTTRKAVEQLVEDGLVERRAGVGVFLCEPENVVRNYRFIAGNLLWDATMRTASAFQRTLVAKKGMVELRDAGGDTKRLVAEIRALPNSGLTGAAIYSIHDEAVGVAIAEVVSGGFPLVVIDEDFASRASATSIVSDNALGGRLAAERLIHAGHRELAFIGDYAADTVRARWAGFKQIAETSSLKPVRIELKTADRLGDWTHSIHDATRRLLKRKVRPTGIFCSCDAVARHVLRALEAHGVQVPRDASLIGFDDDPIAEWTTPALTTIRQDFAALGKTAAEALFARSRKKAAEAVTINVPVSLIVRDTVGRAKKA